MGDGGFKFIFKSIINQYYVFFETTETTETTTFRLSK